jgi:LysR family transcriptional activator of nhaA
LEKSLGAQLFRKEGRGLALTETGRKVLEYANEIFPKGLELLESVRGMKADRPVELRVGVRDVMPKLMAFRLLEPVFSSGKAVRVICREGEMPDLMADLSIHRLDLVLADTPLEASSMIKGYSHLVNQSGILIVGAPALAGRYRRGFPQSLDTAPFVLPTTNCRDMDKWFLEKNLAVRVVAEFADSAMLKIAGSRGLGLFAIPSVMRQEVENMYAVTVLGPMDGVEERYFAISAERKVRHPFVSAILEAAKGRQSDHASS